jgi:predicted dithiol-disulfide oxidoreductase (DUF899 family)
MAPIAWFGQRVAARMPRLAGNGTHGETAWTPEESTMSLPTIVSREQWLAARKELLAKEKELTRHRDEVNADRRRLPMVEITKDYAFEGTKGKVGLQDLFEGRRQLLIYHFMFDPSWDGGCESCSLLVDNIGHLSHLHARDTSLVLVSRAPLDKLDAYQRRMGWTVPWYSAYGSDFNYDFHVSLDPAVAPVEYNYRDAAEIEKENPDWVGWSGELPGISAFLREGGRTFHTYSSYARGGDLLLGTYNWARSHSLRPPGGLGAACRPVRWSVYELGASPRRVRQLA